MKPNANTTRMQLWVDEMSADIFSRVMLHEMGHYLGAKHHKASDSARNALYPTVPPGGNCINSRDIEKVCADRPGGCFGSSVGSRRNRGVLDDGGIARAG